MNLSLYLGSKTTGTQSNTYDLFQYLLNLFFIYSNIVAISAISDGGSCSKVSLGLALLDGGGEWLQVKEKFLS
jgi:hypothetical protein